VPERVGWTEALGVLPLRERAAEAWLGLRGDPSLPPTRFDRTSLPLLKPRFSIPLWLGRHPVARRVVLTNLFNHRQTPIEDGWSVRRTQLEDFRGRDLTYDSHNGTDLAIPPGTRVVAPAGALVVRVSTEFHRGGLKVFLDHGDGLLTGYAHLSRALVAPGQVVARGDAIALSGMSGLDGLTMFPWLAPHVHWNVWLGGAYVDPFARAGRPDEGDVLRGGRDARPADDPPCREPAPARDAVTSPWQHDAAASVLASCRDAATRSRLAAIPDPALRAANVFLERAYFPTRFASVEPLLPGSAPRAPRLDLPFSRVDFDGLVLADEV